MMIRIASTADAPACAAIYEPIVAETAISFETEPPPAAEMARRIDACAGRFPWLVATNGDSGTVLGYAYAAAHRTRAAYRFVVDVSAYVDGVARGRGVGTRLYTVLLRVLRAQGFVRAYAGIALPNEASAALHRAVGFVPFATYRGVGFKAGAWRDVAWYECELAPAAAPPTEPLALESLDLERLLSAGGR